MRASIAILLAVTGCGLERIPSSDADAGTPDICQDWSEQHRGKLGYCDAEVGFALINGHCEVISGCRIADVPGVFATRDQCTACEQR